MEEVLISFSSKDWLFFFSEQLKQIPFFPFVWDAARGNGFGENISSLLWIKTYQYLSIWTLFNIFKLSWFYIELIIFHLSYILLSLFSVGFLINAVFKKRNLIIYLFSFVIYSLNTYALMIFSGGQLGVVLAYASVPFIISAFIKLNDYLDNSKINKSILFEKIIIFTLALSFVVLLDPRISFIAFMGILLLFTYNIVLSLIPSKRNVFSLKSNILKILLIFLVPGILSLLLHLYWLLPFIVFPQNPLIDATGAAPTTGLVKFFSFGDFSHSFSLLHPNWPENIFGKSYFLQPEFLMLPILAYSSLLFIKIKSQNNAEQHAEQRRILFFALLGLIGSFLAKGAKEPFGGAYLWMFNYFPGFNMFRDPTKWYLLIALSYSILIPVSLNSIGELLTSKFKIKKQLSGLFLLFAFCFLLFLIRPLFLGQLKGVFRLYEVPNEYVKFKDFINNQPGFFRTLWIPQRQRYGFYDNMHPAVSAAELFKGASTSAILKILENKNKEFELQSSFKDMGIKYVIVPYDSQGEFFLDDRKYTQKIRDDVDIRLNKISWLKKNDNFKDLAVYELKASNDLFWTSRKSQNLFWKMFSPVRYEISINGADNFDLTFSQKYDPNWVAKINGQEFASKKIDLYKNVFAISKKGSDVIIIEYKLQKILNYGLIISLSTFIISVIVLIKVKKKA